MPQYLLRIEGVNFATTLYDTSDLSTIRGASLALLRVDDAVRALFAEHGTTATLRFAGASQAAFTFDARDQEAASDIAGDIRKGLAGHDVYKYLSFVVDAVPITDSKAALTAVEARNRTRQFRQWTVDLPAFSPATPACDERDRMRPASTKIRVPPKDQVDVFPGDAANDPPDFVEQPASCSVEARRSYGRRERQQFYSKEVKAAAKGLHFTDSFADIVGKLPEPLPPLSLRNKIAVVYADGNKFGSMKGRSAETIERFAAHLKNKRCELLTAILEGFRRAIADPVQKQRFAVPDSRKPEFYGLRFETLMWGGDEFLFVMPSWLALSFADACFRWINDWEFDGQRLTHSMGVAICHHKTPIRQAKAVAEALADSCKTVMASAAPCNAVSFAIFESYMPQDTNLDDYRNRLFGARNREDREKLQSSLALPGDEFPGNIKNINRDQT